MVKRGMGILRVICAIGLVSISANSGAAEQWARPYEQTTLPAPSLLLGSPGALHTMPRADAASAALFSALFYAETGATELRDDWKIVDGKLMKVGQKEVRVRVGDSADHIGVSRRSAGMFVVPFDTVVLFGVDNGDATYLAHYSFRPRSSPPVWLGDEPLQRRPVKLIAATGKGACGVGVLSNAHSMLVWHLGPERTFPENDPMSQPFQGDFPLDSASNRAVDT
jgi:hypothetical protein